MPRKTRLPSPALVIAVIALFVALSGTAVAAGIVPLAKRALVADNAKKVGGQTAAQLGRLQFALKQTPFTLPPDRGEFVSAICDSGRRAISGGFTSPQLAIPLDSLPTADGSGWRVYLLNGEESAPVSGTVYAVCVR